jgi:SAM-dependent methyltransferase
MFATILASKATYVERLCDLLAKFVPYDMRQHIPEVLRNLPPTDEAAVNYLIEELRIQTFAGAKALAPAKASAPAKLSAPAKKGNRHEPSEFEKVITFRATKYLDVGCGVATKTWQTARLLGVPDGNTYGIDLANGWLGYSKPRPFLVHPESGGTSVKGAKLRHYNADGTFPFGDGEFDVISCYMVLHHLREEEQKVMIGEIVRCLRPGGRLILKEHDLDTPADKALADVEHVMYEVAKTGTPYEKYMADYYGEYHGAEHWTSLLSEHFDLESETHDHSPTRGVLFVFRRK